MDNIEFEIPKYKVYIKIDNSNYIIAVDTDAFIFDTTDWIFIDEQTSRHAQNTYFEKPLVNMDGTHNYIYENGEIRETTDEEKEAERASFPPIPPSQMDIIEAQTMYTALMTDTLLEEDF